MFVRYQERISRKKSHQNILVVFDVTQIKSSEDIKPGDEDDGIIGDDTTIGLY